MNGNDVIVSVSSIKDIEKISSNTKYINITIDGASDDVISYFMLNGESFSYSDIVNGRNGFLYADYEMFKQGEDIISSIIDNIPNGLSKLEIVRYLYVSLGRILSSDINTLDDKNEYVSFNKISIINNIWGSLSKGYATDISIAKLFIYVCSRVGIKSDLISSSIKGNIANKVYLDNSFVVVDLYNDIYNIQGRLSTKYFDKYNSDRDMDKKILYIKDDYVNSYLDNYLNSINDIDDDTLYSILTFTSRIFDINRIGSAELTKIYRDIFDKYFGNYDININNFFINRDNFNREHFFVISYNNKYYSFSYNRNSFVNISYDYLDGCLKDNRIGLYDGEEFVMNKEGYVS